MSLEMTRATIVRLLEMHSYERISRSWKDSILLRGNPHCGVVKEILRDSAYFRAQGILVTMQEALRISHSAMIIWT